MEYRKESVISRVLKHYLLPSILLIYCLVGAFWAGVPMYKKSGTVELMGTEALFLSIAPALWLISDLVMYEPILNLSKKQRLVWGTLIFIPAVYVFCSTIFF